MMEQLDPTMMRITEAIVLLHGGDREGARKGFAQIWDEVGADGDPFHRCTLAHYMADAQDDVKDELRWDVRALDAAACLTNERVNAYHSSLSVRGFFPSLHLNLADDYRRLGQVGKAREHLALSKELVDALPHTELGGMLRRGIARMADDLGDAAAPGNDMSI
jgi:hypothetical protein